MTVAQVAAVALMVAVHQTAAGTAVAMTADPQTADLVAVAQVAAEIAVQPVI